MGETFQVEKENFLGEGSFPSSPAWNPRPLYFISPFLLIEASVILDFMDRTR